VIVFIEMLLTLKLAGSAAAVAPGDPTTIRPHA
jgi:hypothetical protein